jgi:DNA-binding response OmpR family regulator
MQFCSKWQNVRNGSVGETQENIPNYSGDQYVVIKGIVVTVAVLTYKEGGEVTGKLFEAGATDVLSPPLNAEVVSTRIGNILTSCSSFLSFANSNRYCRNLRTQTNVDQNERRLSFHRNDYPRKK